MIEKNPFPPINWLWRDYKRAAAWYSGERRRLLRHGGAFWTGDEQLKLHVPVAADLAALSAGMLFAQSPQVNAPHAPTAERIERVFTDGGVYSTLLRAAELASVYGGVFLKWSWRREEGLPRLTAVPADMGLPVYRAGRLEEIRLFTELRRDGEEIWRLEEIYTPDGCIRSRLLRGTRTDLGREVPLKALAETKNLSAVARSGANCMLAAYVPNLLPNRKHPSLNFGRSDFDGLYDLFDALDEAYSALIREVRLTKTTIIVPAEYLRKRELLFTDQRPTWVYANETGVFTALDIDSDRTSSPISVINPDLHAQSRIALCEDILRRIFILAGYAPQSAGLDMNGLAESGTALNARERKSIRTAEVKKTLWWHALNELTRALIRLDSAVFHTNVQPDTPFSVELPALAQPDLNQLSEIVKGLHAADAISAQEKVNLLHPDWSEEKRGEEEKRILREVASRAKQVEG